MSTPLSNDDFINCWNEILVPKWIRFRHILSGNGKFHSDLAYKYFDFQKGDKVLDIGCGFGETSLELGQMVGESGEVFGLDCTKAFLDIANDERDAASSSNVSYELADAQVYEFKKNYYDAAFSRFGVMFFQSAVMAMKNCHHALKPGGKLCLIVWRTLDDNPCWRLAKEVALKHLPPPGDKAQTCGPGPFSMTSEETDRAMLKAAGFTDVELFQRVDVDAFMGSNVDEAIDFQILVGPSGEIIREAGDLGEEKLPLIRAELTELLEPYMTAQGIMMPSSSWAIMARK